MKKHKHFKNNERGIALIFSLAILSIFLVLFLTFAFKARLESRIAKASSHEMISISKAEIIAKNIMAIIKNFDMTANIDSKMTYEPAVSFKDIEFSIYAKQPNNQVFGGDKVLMKALLASPLAINGKRTNKGLVEVLSFNLRDNVKFALTTNAGAFWNLEFNKQGRVIERNAWVLISRNGGINPVGVAKKHNISSIRTGFNIGVIKPVLLLDPKEIPSTTMLAHTANDGYKNYTAQRFSTANELYDMTVTGIDRNNVNIATNLMTNFNPFNNHKKDLLGFIVAPVLHQGSTSYLHSNLGGTMTPYIIPKESDLDVDNIANGIIWLKNWSDADKGDYVDGRTRGKQIAANIKDLLDDDNIPSHDAGYTYFGVEDVPHISEIGIRVDMEETVRIIDSSVPQSVHAYNNYPREALEDHHIKLVSSDGSYAPELILSGKHDIFFNKTLGIWSTVLKVGPITNNKAYQGRYKYHYKIRIIFELANFNHKGKKVKDEILIGAGIVAKFRISGNLTLSSGRAINFNEIVKIDSLSVDSAEHLKIKSPFTQFGKHLPQFGKYKQLRKTFNYLINVYDDGIVKNIHVNTSKIEDFTVSIIDDISLSKNSTVIYDYINTQNSDPTKTFQPQQYISSIDESNNKQGVGWKLKYGDPRHNLFSSNWVGMSDLDAEGTLPDEYFISATQTRLYTEDILDISGSYPEVDLLEIADSIDEEDALKGALTTIAIVNPWEVSTLTYDLVNLYSYNHISSISQLGIVHRGAPWQTLNLSEYNFFSSTTDNNTRRYKSTTTGIYDPLTGSHKDLAKLNGGDANILEQISFNPSVLNVPATIENTYNINGGNIDVFKQLFNNLGDKSASFISDLDNIFKNFSDLLGETITSSIPADSRHTPFAFDELYNPEIRGVMKNYFDANPTNDYVKEDAIVNLVNLVDTQFSYYTLIIAVQQISQIKDSVAMANSTDRSFFTKSGSSNTFAGKVLGGAKMRIDFRRNNVTRKNEILSQQYFNDDSVLIGQ